MEVGLSEKSRKTLAKTLESFLANTYQLYLKTQNAHWNYSGKEFYSVHILLEKQYEEMAEAIDEIAERIRALGFFVSASFSFFLKESQLPELKENFSPMDLLEDVASGHEALISFARRVSQIAENEKDVATLDLLGRRVGVHEKFLWMLKSYL